jgi:hypothetical protein
MTPINLTFFSVRKPFHLKNGHHYNRYVIPLFASWFASIQRLEYSYMDLYNGPEPLIQMGPGVDPRGLWHRRPANESYADWTAITVTDTTTATDTSTADTSTAAMSANAAAYNNRLCPAYCPLPPDLNHDIAQLVEGGIGFVASVLFFAVLCFWVFLVLSFRVWKAEGKIEGGGGGEDEREGEGGWCGDDGDEQAIRSRQCLTAHLTLTPQLD